MIRWPTRWPRRGWLVVVGAVLVVGAAAGVYLGTHSFQSEVSARGQPQGGGQGQPASAQGSGLQLTFSPTNGATAVPLNAPVTVNASGGHLSAVQVTGPLGQPVAGILDPGGGTWSSVPGVLAPLTSYTVQVTGKTSSGKVVEQQASFTTLQPVATLTDDIEPTGGTVGVGMPIVVKFNHAVADKAAVQRALVVQTSTPVVGAWDWLSAKEVHYRPQAYWPTGEHVTLASNLGGVNAGNGIWGVTSRKVGFTVGDAHVSTVDIGSHMMTVTNNGQVVQTFKDSAGRDKYPSMGGAHIVQYKTADLIMDSQSVGIPRNSPDGYYEHVAQDVNISDGGEFVHAAPWSVGSQGNSNVSHGCVNLAPDNAAWFFNFSQRGDIVKIVNSPRPPELTDNGTVDWNTPWDKWVAGSALPVT
jgi:lipoprotein-anchoring transpeptidase ErfK/SrfK